MFPGQDMTNLDGPLVLKYLKVLPKQRWLNKKWCHRKWLCYFLPLISFQSPQAFSARFPWHKPRMSHVIQFSTPHLLKPLHALQQRKINHIHLWNKENSPFHVPSKWSSEQAGLKMRDPRIWWSSLPHSSGHKLGTHGARKGTSRRTQLVFLNIKSFIFNFEANITKKNKPYQTCIYTFIL